MKYYYIFLLFFFGQLSAVAQSAEACSNTFYMLSSDTIYELQPTMEGKLQWLPSFHLPILDSIGAIAFDHDKGIWYGFHQYSAELIAFDRSGKSLNLGRPQADSCSPFPNTDLNSCVYADGWLYVMAYATHSVYAVNLNQTPISYRVLAENIPYGIPTTLAYNPKDNQLYTLTQNGNLVQIHPSSGAVHVFKRGSFSNFPRKKQIAFGKLWFDVMGRCFFMSHQEGSFYELDLEQKIAYEISQIGFNSPKDVTNCQQALAPEFLDADLLSIYFDRYLDGLQLFWKSPNLNNVVDYYFIERYNKALCSWEYLEEKPAISFSGQSNLHGYLDRLLQSGENCYRLRIFYNNGIEHYSQSICEQHPSLPNTAPFHWLAYECMPVHMTMNLLYLNAYSQQELKIELYSLETGSLLWEQEIEVRNPKESLEFKVPNKSGWYYLKVTSPKSSFQYKFYRLP